MATPVQITFDAHDPMAQATFWSTALGYVVQPPPEGYDSWEAFASDVGIPESEIGDLAAAIDPDGSGPRILFQRVPEAKTTKNRVHLDVNVTSPDIPVADRRPLIEAEVERLTALGATRLEDHESHGDTWTIMADPEGNEFCIQ
jgi:hypothetical protein